MEWKTRLAVQYTKGTETVLISPIDSFSPSFRSTSRHCTRAR
ncbi:hypothetical protein NKG94_11120 [Micromonospora sp. M12]